MPHVNVALAAVKAHTARTTPARMLARTTDIPDDEAPLQRLPADQPVRVCVVCYRGGRYTPGSWVTDLGHVLCDRHRNHYRTTDIKRLLKP